MARSAVTYVALVGLFVAGILGILQVGSAWYRAAPATPSDVATPAAPVALAAPVAPVAPVDSVAAPSAARGVAAQLLGNLRLPLALLLLQVLVIIVAARLMGALFERFGQPTVIGEMLAGILLGPSLLGFLWPASQTLIFPPASMGSLQLLSQIGVILFMFLVGVDLDIGHLRQRSQTAVLVSHASIIVPFFLGSVFALLAYPTLAPAGVPFSAFALFLGIAMSITAFPVLARIIEERGLAGTSLGATAIACAAVDDVTAWCLLALVVAIIKAQALAGALATVLLSLAFIALMLLVVRPRTGRLIAAELPDDRQAKGLVAGVLAFLFLCALTTELIGIHALFGAFLAGLAMPRVPSIRDYLKKRLETFCSVLLLPLFFAFTGLRTQVGLLDSVWSWLVCLAVIAVAIVGKLVGSMIAARVTGLTWRDSFALGALMNTRGLVELIVLNLGYDLGILSPRIFAMMVLMALTTTFMTGPLLALYERWNRAAAKLPANGAGAAA